MNSLVRILISIITPVITLFVLEVVTISSFSEESSKTKQIFQRLPEGQLSLDFVLAKSLASSDSFKSIQAQKESIEASALESRSGLDTHAFIATSYYKNDNNEASIFEPKSSRTYSLGVSKLFATGTKLGLEWGDSQSSLQSLNTFQKPNGSLAKFTFKQSLWRDSFGYLTRRNLESGVFTSQASLSMMKGSVENWALGLVNIYYGALLARSRLLSSKTNFESRKRLLEVTRAKLSRGTAERPDFLQVESALLQTKANFQQAANELQQTWRELAVSLKLDEKWIEIAAEEIPLSFDKPHEVALQLCADKSIAASSVEKSIEVQSWKNKLQASEALHRAAQNAYSPQLDLEGEIGGSGALGTASERAESSINGSNPTWKIGLKLELPLEWSLEKAQIQRRATQHIYDQAMFDMAQSNHRTSWVNSCLKLKVLLESKSDLEKANSILSERVQLEERRFQIGLTNTFNVILAGDDKSNSDLILNQTSVALNQTAWQILRLNGMIESHLNEVIRKYGNFELSEIP